MKPAKKSPTQEDDVALNLVERKKNSAHLEVERSTQDLNTLRTQKNSLQSTAAELKVKIAEYDRKIQRNEEVLRAAPTLQRSSEELAELEIQIRALAKDQEFIQRKNDEVVGELQRMTSQRAEKEGDIRQRDFALSQMRKETNPGQYEIIDAGKRVLVAELARGDSELRRHEEEARKFQSRMYDIETRMKRLLADQKLKEQDVIIARRLEIIEAENQRLKREVETLRVNLAQSEADLLKKQRAERTQEEQLHKSQIQEEQVESEATRLKRKSAKLD